ncbi:MAG: cytochrome c, partial [Thiothrix sp.]|nr:cytochrome c [Thiothrix sp.]
MSVLARTGWILALVLILGGCGDPASKEQQDADAAAGQSADGSSQQMAESLPLDQHPGKVLHDANCISCHDTGAYSRVDRKIRNRDQLLAQVRRCDANLGTRLFDEDLEQVADYLNQ